MKRIKEIKKAALASIDGHWGWAILPCLILMGITGIVSAPQSAISIVSNPIFGGTANPVLSVLATVLGFVTTLLTVFLINVLSLGSANSLRMLYRDGDAVNTVPNMFRFAFREGRYWSNVGGMFLVTLFTVLWTLLFIVPGIIKAYAYALTPYILVDNPELGPNSARHRSIEMMRGYKWKLFVLDLSFIGWFLLCILSLGIGLIWLTPYIETSHAAFYQEVLAAYTEKQNA